MDHCWQKQAITVAVELNHHMVTKVGRRRSGFFTKRLHRRSLAQAKRDTCGQL
jgi:hypothetical protein